MLRLLKRLGATDAWFFGVKNARQAHCEAELSGHSWTVEGHLIQLDASDESQASDLLHMLIALEGL